MKHQQASLILDQIEQALQQAQLWSQQAPAPEAFQSTVPFCYDSMKFEHWLQFVLLPRMRALIEGQLPLPLQMNVCPMAEQMLLPLGEHLLPLINRIADLDELLSGQRHQECARA